MKAPHNFVQMNLTQMGFAAGSFDLIFCINTLPYKSDDHQVLSEIRRCLKPDGLAIINTHRESGPTLSASEHRQLHPELDDDYYAVNGDRRVYGEDFFERVTEAGLGCKSASAFGQRSSEFLASNGLKPHNEIILAYVHPSALDRCRHVEIEIH